MIRFILFIFISYGAGQTVVDDLKNEDQIDFSSLPSEKIKKIAQSKRIFIITRENSNIDQGDFISLIYDGKKTARALVVKVNNVIAGIKILKIHSLSAWNQLVPEREVKIIRGDDSFFLNKKKKLAQKPDDKALIKSEEDLFNKTSLDEDINIFEENPRRHIQGDNIASLGIGRIEGRDSSDTSQSHTHVNGSWAYQFKDNIFGEFLFGQNSIENFPAEGLDTIMSNYTVRLKYTFPTSFHVLFQPYVGFQIINAEAPGLYNDPETPTAQLSREEDRLAGLQKSHFIFGITILKKLVPAWFIRANLGIDLVNLGLSVEF
ncbi:MAG: hypothetical protein OXB84_07085, partial [Halobacteriovoraceae bacterium]|nr:hypothetical protein [Halobacteriovoraceae bacterium]